MNIKTFHPTAAYTVLLKRMAVNATYYKREKILTRLPN